MISYAEEAACYLHDFKEEEKTSIKIIDSYLSDSYIYQDSIYYEYTLVFELKISKVKINDCYLTLKFNSKAYTFNIGSFEIVDKVVSNNPLIITNLYGLTKNEEASLKGIVITITNPFDYDVIIQDVFIGSNHHVILNTLNKTEIKDSNKIEDYKYVYEERKLLLKANEEATFLLPIEVIKDYYLSECFLIFKIGDIDYCLKNFTFVKTNDLSTVNKYLNEGMIYAV